jgi:hypothetical protein
VASEGHLVFPNSASATKGIQDFARTINHMELHWGEDLRVDPLTPDFAVIATPWHEIRVDTSGNRVDETGFLPRLPNTETGTGNFGMPIGQSPVPLQPSVSFTNQSG